MLDNEDVLLYVKRAKNGDNGAKEELLKRNSPLLKSIVKKFCNKGVEYDDLYQLACIGFLKAITNFDESYNVKFTTYTVPLVIGEIKRYMRDNGAIKVSRTLKVLAIKINKKIEELKSKDTPLNIEQIANELGVTAEDVVMAMDASKMPVSLYDKDEDNEKSPELIEKVSSGNGEEDLIDKIMLNDIIENLSEREKKIIILRYFRDRTQSEIAADMGVSQVQISRLESKILNKIKSEF